MPIIPNLLKGTSGCPRHSNPWLSPTVASFDKPPSILDWIWIQAWNQTQGTESSDFSLISDFFSTSRTTLPDIEESTCCCKQIQRRHLVSPWMKWYCQTLSIHKPRLHQSFSISLVSGRSHFNFSKGHCLGKAVYSRPRIRSANCPSMCVCLVWHLMLIALELVGHSFVYSQDL